MLTPKRNGSGRDSFSEVSHHDKDEPAGIRSRKPLSQILREERERKNISLQEVAKLTHIPLNYLQLLEGEEDERVVPDSMYLIASLRGYADFLDIEQGAALTQFIAELKQGPPVKERAGSSVRPPRSLNPFSQQWSRVLPRTLLLLLALGLLAFLGSYSALTRKQQLTKDKIAPLPSPSATPAAPASGTPPAVSSPASSASPPEAGQVQSVSPPAAVSPPVAATPQAESSVASAPGVELPGKTLHRLHVQAKAQTWLRVTIDGQHTKDLLLRPGQAVEWTAETGFSLTLGNASGVDLTLDGQDLPPLGKAGQVVRNVRLPAQGDRLKSQY